VRSVEDLVGLVPYLIGFHPEESLVVVVLREGRVVVTARVDLAAVAGEAALDSLLGRLFGRFPDAEGWFLAYTDDDRLAWDVLASCVELVGLVRLGRLLQVGTSTWRADCPDGPGGTITGAVGPAAAEAAVLGLPARSSRRDLAAGLAGPPGTDVEALSGEAAERSAELEALGVRGRRRLLRRLLAAEEPPSVSDGVRLALLAVRPECQLDALRDLGQETADRQLRAWSGAVRRSLGAQRPSVLGLLGMAAWQTGDGALQVVCLEQIDLVDPAVPLAAVLDWLNAEVVPPSAWPELRGAVLGALTDLFRAAGPPASRRRR